MNKKLIVFCILILMRSTALALQITSPGEDQLFYAGDEFSVIVKPGTGEDWLGVMYGVEQMDYSFLSNEYSARVKIPRDMLGYQYLSVVGVSKTGTEVELKRRVVIKLPSNVVLKSILLGNEIMALRKVPEGSNLVDAAKIETRQLGVAGMYSDGVQRYITSSADGTTYASSNEDIVTVSPEGKVRAKGVGAAIITVRNGRYISSIKVIVKPYRKN